MAGLLPLGKDPYALAYKYRELMQEKPKRPKDRFNSYYDNLLANQPYPPDDAMDDRSRAIRYAKEHYESFYEPRHVNLIVQLLNRKAKATVERVTPPREATSRTTSRRAAK
jgi:hypothetical protein